MTALAVSLCLHALLLVNFFASAGGAPFTGGAVPPGRDEPAFIVTLAGMKSPKSVKPTPQQQLDQMLAQQRANPSPVVVDPPRPKPPQSLSDLFAAVDQAHGGATPNQPAGKSKLALGGTGADANGARRPDQGSKTPHNGPKPATTPGAAVSSGALWGQIQPCWNKLPAGSPIPVTLEITLNGEGRIAIPPKIVRPNTEPPNEHRLIAEARALSAVSACVPYKGAELTARGKVFRVDFVSLH